MRGERIQLHVPLKAGHHRPASETPFKKRHSNGVSLAGRYWPNIECWLVIFQGIRTSNANRNPIFLSVCFFFRGGGGGGGGSKNESQYVHL